MDSYSGWYEIDLLLDITTSAVISKLKRHFSVHGAPHTLISDNARQYTSQHFKDFAKQWDFIHTTSSPEYPQSNDLAERAVRSAKELMEKSHKERTDVFLNLLNVRNIPRDSILGSPAQRLMSRETRAAIPVSTNLLKPSLKCTQQINAQLLNKRLTLKRHYNKSSHPLRPLAEGQVVCMQTPKGYDQLGTVQGMSKEPRSYMIQSKAATYRRNRRCILPVAESPPQPHTKDSDPRDTGPSLMTSVPPTTEMPEPYAVCTQPPSPLQPVPKPHSPIKDRTARYMTRSGRTCRPKLSLSVYACCRSMLG